MEGMQDSDFTKTGVHGRYQSDGEQDERIHMEEKCDGRGGLDQLQIVFQNRKS